MGIRGRITTGMEGKVLLAAAVIAGLYWFYFVTKCFSTPPVAELAFSNPYETPYMRLDPNSEIRHEWRPLSKISPFLQQAVVLAEDDRFYDHPGYDIEAIKKAYKVNKRRGRFARGASTITQQLARNLYLSPRKSILRKGKELLIALKLERTLSKDRILELYLNVVEWGNGIYGAEAAAKHYFGTSAASLTREQAAYLSSILPRPKFYDKRRGAKLPKRRAASIVQRL